MGLSTAVDLSAVARVVGIKTEFKDLRGGNIVFLPQRVALFGLGNVASIHSFDKRQVTSASEVAEIYGFGSPLHLATKQLLPVNGDGLGTIPLTIYPLEDAALGLESIGDITPIGIPAKTASYIVRINNIDSPFIINVGDDLAAITTAITTAINANLDMPVIANVNLTVTELIAKWTGTSSNDIFIEIIAPIDSDVTFGITQMSGGAVDPDVNTTLAQVGNVWETLIINCQPIADTIALDAYNVFGEGRWGPLTRKPCVVFTGNTATTVAAATVITDVRKTDRVNSQLVAPGSNDFPFVVAARQVARIAVLANNNPPHDYGSQNADGLVPGADGDQWNYIQRDQAVKAGSSTIEVKDGVINVSDVVTFYHPDGDPIPAYRFVVDIIKLQNIIFNLDLEFATAKWDGAPLIPDDQPTTNPDAKKPKTAVAAVSSILDGLALNAVISDPETAKANTFAEIDSSNPKRLNIVTTIQLSGNTNIISIDLNFGFFFGTPEIIA